MGQAASRQEAFWEACGFGHKERVRRYLEMDGIDVNWVSYTHDCCPIHVASQGKPEIVEMLIAANCNVNVQDNRGNTPVHHAAMKGHADIIKTLTEAGAEVNVQDKNCWTPLHCACYWNHSKTVRVLLNLGADVNIQNKDKRTALHETARSQEADDISLGEITQMLIDGGTDLNCKGCSDLGDLEADFTGLMYAAYHNHPDVANALIEAGCDVNSYGSNLWTALHWAADRGHEEMVYLLLGAGADPTKKGLRGEIAADRAEKNDLKEMLINAVNMFNEIAMLNKDKDASLTKEASGENLSTSDFPKEKASEKGEITTESDSKYSKTKESTSDTVESDMSKLKINTNNKTGAGNVKGDNLDCSCGESESKLLTDVSNLKIDDTQTLQSDTVECVTKTDNSTEEDLNIGDNELTKPNIESESRANDKSDEVVQTENIEVIKDECTS